MSQTTENNNINMNKIIIDTLEEIDIKDNTIDLSIKTKKLTINVEGQVLINEIENKNEDLELTINLKEKSTLIYNRFMIHEKMNNIITINQNNKSNIIFNYSIIANNKNNLIIKSNINGNDNNTEINVKAITQNEGNCVIETTGSIKEKVENNNLIENIKVLLLNDKESVIVPNLLVSSNEVEVNHAATISGIDKNYMFYLNSKGINNNNAIKLIKNGFLLSNMNIKEETKEMIKQMIEN